MPLGVPHKLSEYDLDMPQSHTTEQPMEPRGKDKQRLTQNMHVTLNSRLDLSEPRRVIHNYTTKIRLKHQTRAVLTKKHSVYNNRNSNL